MTGAATVVTIDSAAGFERSRLFDTFCQELSYSQNTVVEPLLRFLRVAREASRMVVK